MSAEKRLWTVGISFNRFNNFDLTQDKKQQLTTFTGAFKLWGLQIKDKNKKN